MLLYSIIGILFITLVLIIFKLRLKYTTGWNNSPTCLIGKTAIVTGANIGIGYYTALDFAKRSARVILACRDDGKAEEARQKIIQSTGNSNIVVRRLDLASLAAIRKFSEKIKSTEERLDILVNNAGAMNLDFIKTVDGIDLTMQVNHFGPFLLTNLLIELLKKSKPSRIVNVASLGAKWGILDFSDLNTKPKPNFTKLQNYAKSKLCNIIFTNELARKLKGSGVTTNSLHPGVIQTELFRYAMGIEKFIVVGLRNLFFKTPEEGAQTSIYLAVSKEVDGISGKYFSDCKECEMLKIAECEATAIKLWEKSEELVGLTQEEKRSLLDEAS